MEQLFQFADELGPANVIAVYKPKLNLRGLLVVDNVAAGPAIGGCRMAPDVTLAECFRLARAMTLKNAAAGLRHGGAKSVIVGDPRMPVSARRRSSAPSLGRSVIFTITSWGPTWGPMSARWPGFTMRPGARSVCRAKSGVFPLMRSVPPASGSRLPPRPCRIWADQTGGRACRHSGVRRGREIRRPLSRSRARFSSPRPILPERSQSSGPRCRSADRVQGRRRKCAGFR